MSKYILEFTKARAKDVKRVGGKNASLGEMVNKLSKKGIQLPPGFAVTATAFQDFLKLNKIDREVWRRVEAIDVTNTSELAREGKVIRDLILSNPVPEKMRAEIVEAYRSLSKQIKVKNINVAVRSSATAEDLPSASFAGQHDSYLNIHGAGHVVDAVRQCFASLFTDRAISYRVNHKFKHRQVSMSAGVQMMVRSDRAAAGTMFTIDTESGFTDVVSIDSSWGYGEAVVQGLVVPDHFVVFKKGLDKYRPILERKLGTKKWKMIAKSDVGSKRVRATASEQTKFSISDNEVLQLAKWAIQIEKTYKLPMDIEWAKDSGTKKLYIVQARPETVEARKNTEIVERYRLERTGRILARGTAIGSKIGSGKAHLITSPKQLSKFKPGEVLVTKMTDPAWEPIMKKAAAIVTDHGGRTSHAAIVSRELGVPAIVGAGNATKVIKNGAQVTVSCGEGEEGHIYAGVLPYRVRRTNVSKIKKPPVQVMMNLGDPGQAFDLSHIPNDGVGLAREEFIVANMIGVHPMALVKFQKLKDQKTKKQIEKLLVGYDKPTDLFVERLASGIAKIAAAFYPNDVIVRFSDFKTNEYASLIGGELFEPKEENPMLGWRGASRYYDPEFEPAFLLECEAFRRVRDDMGLTNVVPMVPFCRTVGEGKKVFKTMAKGGLRKGKNGLRVYVMIEIPSNVILADQFAEIFDGFSIGSNDLTQLTLGVDRDTTKLHTLSDERNEAVVTLVKEVIKKARQSGTKIGICGQAPSDYPEFAAMLIKAGIDSISLNPDSVLPTRLALSKKSS